MSETTSLEPTSSGGWCSCSSQRCLNVVLLQTRVQVVYLCSYLLLSKVLALLFGVAFKIVIYYYFYFLRAVHNLRIRPTITSLALHHIETMNFRRQL